jgi:hypothetical protein
MDEEDLSSNPIVVKQDPNPDESQIKNIPTEMNENPRFETNEDA